jgi:hypothetical protein
MKKLILSVLAVLLMTVLSVSAADLNVSGVTVTPTSGNPGTEVTFKVDLTNTGTSPITTVHLTSTALQDSSSNSINVPTISDVTNLVNGTPQSQTWKVTLPKTLAGTYTATLTVTDGTTTVSKAYSVTVNSYNAMSTSPTSLSVVGQKGDSEQTSFVITNDGSTNLDITLAASKIEDNDYDEATVTLSDTSVTALAPGATKKIDIDLDLDSSMDVGDYTGNVTLTAGTLTKTVAINLEVEPEICEDGKVGDLDITINEPDDGEDFSVGETIQVEVDVENDYDKDMDVVVTAILYDVTDDEEVKTVKLSAEEIDDDDDREFEFDLEIPTSDKIDTDNTFYLYVKACKKNSEDDHCDYDRVRIDLDREDDDVAITEFTVSPTTGLKAGSSMNVNVEVTNIGTDEQDDVYIQIKSKELGISATSKKFDLEEYDDKDNDYEEQFLVKIPDTAKAGTYWLDAFVNYDDGDEQKSKQIQITVESGSASSTTGTSSTTAVKGVTLTVDKEKISLTQTQKKWAIPVVLENKGTSTAKLKLDATELSSWAKVLSVEAPQELHAGEKYHSYIYLELKDGVQEGVHNLRVNLRDASGLLQSKMLSVTVPAEATTSTAAVTGTTVKEPSKVKEFFSSKSKIFWIIGDIVLLVIAIFFIRLLFKK